jgi:hypothetical protein
MLAADESRLLNFVQRRDRSMKPVAVIHERQGVVHRKRAPTSQGRRCRVNPCEVRRVCMSPVTAQPHLLQGLTNDMFKLWRWHTGPHWPFWPFLSLILASLICNSADCR